MAAFCIFIKHLVVLTLDELRDLLCGRKAALFLLFYFITIFGLLRLIIETLSNSYVPLLDETSIEQYRLREFLQGVDVPGAYELFVQLAQLPVALVAFQIFSVLWLPLLVTLYSSDVISSDLARGTLRFILLRTSRLAFYSSKLVAHIVFYALLQAASLILLLFMLNNSLDETLQAKSYSAAWIYFLMTLPFIFCLVTGTSCVSVWTKRARTAMIVVQLIWVWFFICVFFMPLLSPFNISNTLGIVAPFQHYGRASVVGLSVWGIGFSLLGMLSFVRREV